MIRSGFVAPRVIVVVSLCRAYARVMTGRKEMEASVDLRFQPDLQPAPLPPLLAASSYNLENGFGPTFHAVDCSKAETG